MKTRRVAAGSGAGAGAGLFVVWAAGHFGVALSAEDGAIIASAGMTAGAAIAHQGIVGIFRTLLFGRKPSR